VIEDARDLIFPLFSVRADGNGIYLGSRTFLGTGFFVSRCGDAITAAHLLPPPDTLPEGRRLVAVVTLAGREEVCWVTHAAAFDAWDLALVHVNLSATQHLQIVPSAVVAGSDVQFLGIADHEVWGAGKELRILKGHVTMAVAPWLELSCSVPRGMSGSPLFMAERVIGCVVGTFRTEQVEDSMEEARETRGEQVTIRRTEVRRAFEYGKAFGFAAAATTPLPPLNNKTLVAFLRERNGEP
jgi:trypsin-like peptidase